MGSEVESANLFDESNRLRDQIKCARDSYNDAELKKESQKIPPLERLAIRSRKTLKGHMSKIYSLDWLVDSQHLLSASQDGFMMIWDPISTNKLAAIPLKCSWVMACGYAPDGSFVASGGLDNSCSIFSVKPDNNGQNLIKEMNGHTAYISSVKILDENRILTTSGDRSIVLWDWKSSKPVTQFISHAKGVMTLEVQPGSDNQIFATGSCDSTTKIWDIRTGSCSQTFTGHTKDVNDISFFPSGLAIGTASEDGTSKLYDLRADQELATYETGLAKDGSEFITSIGFSKSGRLMFTGRFDNCIQINDTLKGEVLTTLIGHENIVQCLKVSPNGAGFATGSWDSLVKIWV